MKIHRILLITSLLVVAGGILFSPVIIAQDDTSKEDASSEKNDAGLGGLMADSLKNLLKTGTIFTPNGESAKPVDSDLPEQFKVNFNNAPIDQVLMFMSDLTKKVILKSKEVNAQISIINPNEVTREEALALIDAAFMLEKITYLEYDNMIVVLTAAAAKQQGVDVNVGAGREGSGRIESRVIELKYASPSQLKTSLAELISENANILADDRTKKLVITDTISNINRLETIIKQLDKEGASADIAIRVFKLRYASAPEIARNLDDVLATIVTATLSQGDNSNARDQRRSADQVCEVIADRTSNSLILSAPSAAIDAVADFIMKMDTSSITNMTTETFTLESGDATEIAQGLQQFTYARRTSFYRPIVFADSRSNSVVVHAYPEDVEAISNVLETLDSKQAYDKKIKVFTLENADAIVLSAMVQQLLTGEEQNSRNSYSYWGYGGRGRGRNEEDQIQIIEDQRLNALIVSAKPVDFPLIEELIMELDQSLPQSKEEPRVFPIKNVRASDLAYMIEEIFSESQSGNRGYNPWNFGGRSGQQQQLTGLTGKVKTIADPPTNSLICIASTPRAFKVIEKLIEQLDQEASELGTTRVFRLNNANAIDLADQLTTLFEEDNSQGGGNRGFFWYGNNQQQGMDDQINNLIGNVRIVSESRTNSLMVTTSIHYFDAIEKLINDLDRESEQILIEILIVEIMDISDEKLGIDWPGNIPVSVDGSFDAPLTGMNLDRAAVLSNTAFDAALDFLASSNKSNVLAKPNILTGNNQGAYVDVSNRIPVMGAVSQGVGGNLSSVGWEEPGLKLTVTPHINNATTVTIDVDLETGQVIDQYSLTVNGTTTPAFSKRIVQTRLTINDKETAVLSGVIDTRFVDTERGVPGLMHIPLLGSLFKTKGKVKSKTEMLTFITPYILPDGAARQEMFERQRQRIEMYKQFKTMMDEIDIKVGNS